MSKIQIIKIDNEQNILHAFSIRETVFIKEQGVTTEEEFDVWDNLATHFLALRKEKPVATARCQLTEKGVKLERFSVLKEFRRCGIGSRLLDFMLNDQILSGNNFFYLHSQLDAVNFYSRLGFVPQGDTFLEAGIEHILMTRNIK